MDKLSLLLLLVLVLALVSVLVIVLILVLMVSVVMGRIFSIEPKILLVERILTRKKPDPRTTPVKNSDRRNNSELLLPVQRDRYSCC